jgi:AAA domain
MKTNPRATFREYDNASTHESEQPDHLAALLDARRFDVTKPPAPSRAVYSIADATIATAGNLVVIQAQAKAGKTAFVGALLAAAMDGSGDTLGIQSRNEAGGAVVHFDTEQSPADHHSVVSVALRRAGVAEPPEWLRSYRLADVTLKERRAALEYELHRALTEHGSLHSAIVDGVGDLCADPNETSEALALVDDLHRLAIKFAIPLVLILHENPGSDSGKTRGHLGSQLERKAETNLRLAKDGDGITVVFADKARHAHIPKDRGQRFKWCDEARMHVVTESKSNARTTAKRAKAEEMARIAFDGTPAAVGMSWTLRW